MASRGNRHCANCIGTLSFRTACLCVPEIVLMVDNSASLGLLDARHRDLYEQLINLFILLSYPINFFIYCGMSQQFRHTFCALVAPCFAPCSQLRPLDTAVEERTPRPPAAELDNVARTGPRSEKGSSSRGIRGAQENSHIGGVDDQLHRNC